MNFGGLKWDEDGYIDYGAGLNSQMADFAMLLSHHYMKNLVNKPKEAQIFWT